MLVVSVVDMRHHTNISVDNLPIDETMHLTEHFKWEPGTYECQSRTDSHTQNWSLDILLTC